MKINPNKKEKKSHSYFPSNRLKQISPIQTDRLITEVTLNHISLTEAQKNEQLRMLDKMYQKDHIGIFNKMKEDLQKDSENAELNQEQLFKKKFGFNFQRTNYSTQSSFNEFYHKFHQYRIINRKQPFEKETPSLAFIKSTKEEKIIPNPLGLLKRSGDTWIIDIGNQKVGDSYIKALSSSMRYVDNIKEMNLQSNRIMQAGALSLFQAFNTNKLLRYHLRILNLKGNNIGDKGIEGLVNYITDRDCQLEELNVEDNQLGDKNIQILSDSIAKNSPYRMIIIKYGKNHIGNDSASAIANMIVACNNLREFSINWNRLTNVGSTLIVNKLRPHSELRILDFSWNCIGNDLNQEPAFEEVVEYDKLQPARNFHNFELFTITKTMKFAFKRSPLLPPIDPTGGKAKPADDKNKGKRGTERRQTRKLTMKGKIPIKEPSPFAKELGAFFREPSIGLVHLDISHNNLPYQDANHLANEVKDNHTILGMHLDGNEISIDNLGFLEATRNEDKAEGYYPKSQIYYGLGSDPVITKTSIESVRKIRSKNKCWICEGWREIEFEFTPTKPIIDATLHMVKLHLSFEDWKPYDMLFQGNKYHIRRMCPPGDVQYFFTIDTVPFTQYGEEIRHLSHGNQILYEFDDEFMDEFDNLQSKIRYGNNNNQSSTNIPELSTQVTQPTQVVSQTFEELHKQSEDIMQMRKITITCVGHKNVKHNNAVITEDYRKTFKYCEPRPVKIFNRFVKPRTPWTYPISIWAYYDYPQDGDSEEYLDKCFENDFERCHFEKDVKEPTKLLEMKEYLRKKYRDIIDCYKNYASYCGFNVWQITQNYLTEFVSKCTGLCDKTYDINNIYLTVKAICGNLTDKDERIKNNNKNLSDNVVRHQFMSLLVKGAKDKYVRTFQTMTDVFEAVKFSFENHYDYAIKGFEYHQWRKDRYYNEQVDNFLKAYLPIFDAVYKTFAKQKGPKKRDIWMVLDEYNELVTSFVNIDEYPIRDNPLIFNQSLRLQVSEINNVNDKHLNMFFPEFLEAICRAIDKASPFPMDEQESDWSKERRIAQPLINKLENIIAILVKLINNPDYAQLKMKFPMPVKDLATGLYVINYELNWYQGLMIGPAKIKVES